MKTNHPIRLLDLQWCPVDISNEYKTAREFLQTLLISHLKEKNNVKYSHIRFISSQIMESILIRAINENLVIKDAPKELMPYMIDIVMNTIGLPPHRSFIPEVQSLKFFVKLDSFIHEFQITIDDINPQSENKSYNKPQIEFRYVDIAMEL